MSATPSFDRPDLRTEVQAALSSLNYARQVLLHTVALLDGPVQLDAPNPVEPPQAPQPGTVRSVRADRLVQLAALPPTAKFTAEEAALYMNCRVELLRTWRWQKRGPEFEGAGRFTRYTKVNLDRFMAA
jgi:hypothetical protein